MSEATEPLLLPDEHDDQLDVRRLRNNTNMSVLIILLVLSVLPGFSIAMSKQSKDAYMNWIYNNIVPLFLLVLCFIWSIYSLMIDCCCRRQLSHGGCLTNRGIICGGWFLLQFPIVITAIASSFLEKELATTKGKLAASEKQNSIASTIIISEALRRQSEQRVGLPALEAQEGPADSTSIPIDESAPKLTLESSITIPKVAITMDPRGLVGIKL